MLPFSLAAITLAAALLFCVQPLAARLVLPVLGGAPAVWATSMVFFQAVLLAAYGYAHWLGARSRSVQLIVHSAVLLAGVLVLPISLRTIAPPPTDAAPLLWLLVTLIMSAGPVFFALAATSPLVQRWFAQSTHPRANDPYFLSVASNLGSCVGLLAYPLALEPLLGLRQQGIAWGLAYCVAAVLIILALLVCTRRSPAEQPAITTAQPKRLTRGTQLTWLVLSFVPSALLVGVTTHISTDIAAIPLLWALPLLLYLVTFMLAFSPRVRLNPAVLGRALVILALVVLFVLIPKAEGALWLLLPLHVLAFFIAAWMCHARLAARRPDTQHLTRYYFIMSLGGVLGGAFAALLAPVIFSHVIEYPLVLGLALLLRPLVTTLPATKRIILSLGAAAVIIATIFLLAHNMAALALPPRMVIALMGGLPVLLCALLFVYRRGEIAGLALAAALTVSPFALRGANSIHRERTFFGVHEVLAFGNTRTLFHGTTAHGKQDLISDATRAIATTYYHASGPAGEIFTMMRDTNRDTNIALIGMGAGTLAAYGREGQTMTFYEIDPAVARIASDQRFFTFLRDSKARIRVVLGDGRLLFEREANADTNLIVLDAFSSDAIPVHLLTREAFDLYRSRLAPDGVILVHISNRHFNLAPELASIARDIGWHCAVRIDPIVTESQRAEGKQESVWAVLTANRANLGRLAKFSLWDDAAIKYQSKMPQRAWTDDYAPTLRTLVVGE
jgi:hypothetical protein